MSPSDFNRLIAFFLSVCLLIQPALHAADSEFLSSPRNRESAANVPPVNDPFDLPPYLGTIAESFQGSSDKTVLYIEDAHASLEAQENISKIINYLVEHHGVKTVFEEGCEGRVLTDDYFGFIKDAAIKKEVSYFLLEKLRIGGAEYAHINRKADFELLGADNLKFHKENIAAYRKNARFKKRILQELEAMNSEVKILANRYFPKEMKEQMKLKDRFESSEVPPVDYLKRMIGMAQGEGGQISSIVRQILGGNPKEFFNTLNILENKIANQYLTSDRDAKIFQYHKQLSILKRLIEIKLTSDEYETVLPIVKDMRTQDVANFIAREGKKSIVLSSRWERHLNHAVRFYELAHKRDEAVEKALKEYLEPASSRSDARNDGRGPAVLVFGGFHRNSIRSILKRNGYSFVIMTPKMSAPDPLRQSYYKQLMAAGHHAFEAPFYGTNSTSPEHGYSWPGARAEIQSIYEEVLASPGLSLPILTGQLEKKAASDLEEVNDASVKGINRADRSRSEVRNPEKEIQLDEVNGDLITELFHRNVHEKKIIDTSERESVKTPEGMMINYIPARYNRGEKIHALPKPYTYRVEGFTLSTAIAPALSYQTVLFEAYEGASPSMDELARIFKLAKRLPGFGLYFNGPGSGASYIQRQHYQIVKSIFQLEERPMKVHFNSGAYEIGLVRDYPISGIKFRGKVEGDGEELLNLIQPAVEFFNETKTAYNLYIRYFENGEMQVILVPRKLERSQHITNLPGFPELGGIMTTENRADFEKNKDGRSYAKMLREVGFNAEELQPLLKLLYTVVLGADLSADEIFKESIKENTSEFIAKFKKYLPHVSNKLHRARFYFLLYEHLRQLPQSQAEAENFKKEGMASIAEAVSDAVTAVEKKRKPGRNLLRDSKVVVKAPVRLDIASGLSSDLFPISMEKGGRVINAAIRLNSRKPITVEIQPIKKPVVQIYLQQFGQKLDVTSAAEMKDYKRDDDLFRLVKAAIVEAHLDEETGYRVTVNVEDIPRGSGLGVSSIMTAALLKALYRFASQEISNDEIVLHTMNVEQRIDVGGGWQDAMGAFTGGVKVIETPPGIPVPTLRQVSLSEEFLDRFKENIVLVYSGQPHFMGSLLEKIVWSYETRRPVSYRAMRSAAVLRDDMIAALEKNDLQGFGERLTPYWETQKQQLDAETVSSPLIDDIFEVAKDLIAGGKSSGAGGGGFLMLAPKEGKRNELIQRLNGFLRNKDGRVYDFEFDNDGMTVQVLDLHPSQETRSEIAHKLNPRSEIKTEKWNPIMLLAEDPELKDFFQDVLKKRYTSWGLPEPLAERILNQLLNYIDDPEQARQKVYENVIDINTDVIWKAAYQKFRGIKYDAIYKRIKPFVQRLPAGSIVLDVGSGENEFGKVIAQNHAGIHVIGTDIYQYGVSDKSFGLPNLSYVKQPDSVHLPSEIKNKSVDVVSLNLVLHHLSPDNLPVVLREVSRILKPGGKVLVTEDTYSLNKPFSSGADRKLSARFRTLVKQKGESFAANFFMFNDWYANIVIGRLTGMSLPYNFHSMESWVNIFEQAGFEIMDARHQGFPKETFHRPNSGTFILQKRSEIRLTSFPRTGQARTVQQKGTFLMDADVLAALNPAQKDEIFSRLYQNRSGLRLIVFNEHGQIADSDRALNAILKLPNIRLTLESSYEEALKKFGLPGGRIVLFLRPGQELGGLTYPLLNGVLLKESPGTFIFGEKLLAGNAPLGVPNKNGVFDPPESLLSSLSQQNLAYLAVAYAA